MEPCKNPYSITLTAEVDSEWPIQSLVWCKDEKLLQISDNYSVSNSISTCTLQIFDVKEAGDFQLIAENVAGVSKSNIVTLCYEGKRDRKID